MVRGPLENMNTTSDESSLLTTRIIIQGDPPFDYYLCKPSIKKNKKYGRGYITIDTEIGHEMVFSHLSSKLHHQVS
jgi:hypothetical protein